MGGINSNVILIFKGDGAAGAIFDKSYGAGTIVNSGVVVSAVASALGGGAHYFGGGAGQTFRYEKTAMDGFWTVSAYTIDWWMQIGNSKTNIGTERLFNIGSNQHKVNIGINSNRLYLYFASLTIAGSVILDYTSHGFDPNSYIGSLHHYAFVVTGSTSIAMFIDGIKKNAGIFSFVASHLAASNYANSGLFMGNLSYTTGASAFKGYIDEFRITKGVAVWTEDFTPPTEPYTYDLPTSELDLAATVNYPRIITSTALEYANKFRNDVVRKGIDLSTDVIRGCLMSAGFMFDKDAHHYWSQVDSYATSVQNLLTPTITENDTSDVISIALSGMSWTVSAIQSLAGILLYDETTSNVIGYISYPTTMPANMPLVVTGVGIKVS